MSTLLCANTLTHLTLPRTSCSLTARSMRSVRERKQVTVLTPEVPESAEKTFAAPSGPGVKLGDVAYIADQLQKRLGVDDALKVLHRVLFNEISARKTVKAHIRLFCGFDPAHVEKQSMSARDKLNKLTMAGLKDVCETLGLEKGGSKEAVVERIVEFLKSPTDQAPAVKRRASGAATKKKSAAAVKKSTVAKKKSATPAKKGGKKAEDNDVVESDDGDEEENVDVDTDEEEEDVKVDGEKPVAKKSKTAESPKKPSPVTPPSDAELREALIEILKAADLNTMTKKKARAALEDHFKVRVPDAQWFAERREMINEMIETGIAQL